MYQDREMEREASSSGAHNDIVARRVEFGQRLRALRDSQGVSIEALAEITRISQVFIEALETGAMDRLPGRVFGRGFVQNIAKNFSVDPAPWLEEFAAVWESSPAPSVLKVEIKNKPTKDFGEKFQPIIAQLSSLAKRGELVKLALPVCALVLAGYLVTSRSLVQTAFKNLQSNRNHAAMLKAKNLDLRPTESQVAEQSTNPVSQPLATAKVVDEAAPRQDVAAPATAKVPDKPSVKAVATGVGATGVKKTADKAGPDSGSVATVVAGADGRSDAKLSINGTPENEQTLLLIVAEPVRIRLDVDQGPAVTRELTPDTYKFTFNKKADMMIYDASAVQISFNGRPLGALGTKGRVRRLSFQSQAPQLKKI